MNDKSKKARTRVDSGGCVAFTLVELLVVIAILGVLMGIILPVVNRARGYADAIDETAAIKRLGMATLEYGADNNRLPNVFSKVYPHKTANRRYLVSALEEQLDISALSPGELVSDIVSKKVFGWYTGLGEPQKAGAIVYFAVTQVYSPDGSMLQPFGSPFASPELRLDAPGFVGVMSRIDPAATEMLKATTSYNWPERATMYPPRKYHPVFYYDGHVEMNVRK